MFCSFEWHRSKLVITSGRALVAAREAPFLSLYRRFPPIIGKGESRRVWFPLLREAYQAIASTQISMQRSGQHLTSLAFAVAQLLVTAPFCGLRVILLLRSLANGRYVTQVPERRSPCREWPSVGTSCQRQGGKAPKRTHMASMLMISPRASLPILMYIITIISHSIR